MFVTVGRNGKAANNGGTATIAPHYCDRPNCKGYIPTEALAYKTFKGQTAMCLECLKLKPPQTRFYKLSPGVERLFNFEGTSNPNGQPKAARVPNTKGIGEGQEARLKQQDAKIAELEKKLAFSNKGGEGGGDPSKDESAGASPQGFSKEDSLELKKLKKDADKLEALDEDEARLYFPVFGSFDVRRKAIKDDMQAIWAKNRARLPFKAQLEKAKMYVAKQETELAEARNEMAALLIRYKELDEDVATRVQHINLKKAEVADLALKTAQQEAVPAGVEPHVDPTQPVDVVSGLSEEEKLSLSLLKRLLQQSGDLHSILKAAGATDDELKKAEHAWSKVAGLAEASLAAPTSAKDPLSKESPKGVAAVGAQGQAPEMQSPESKPIPDDDMGNAEELDKLWELHLLNHSDVANLPSEEMATRRQIFNEVNRVIKRSNLN
jgi:hypothetical protein